MISNPEGKGGRVDSSDSNDDQGWGSLSMLERYGGKVKEETKKKIDAINRGEDKMTMDPTKSSEYRGWKKKSMLESLGAKVDPEAKKAIFAINEDYDERVKASQGGTPVFSGGKANKTVGLNIDDRTNPDSNQGNELDEASTDVVDDINKRAVFTGSEEKTTVGNYGSWGDANVGPTGDFHAVARLEQIKKDNKRGDKLDEIMNSASETKPETNGTEELQGEKSGIKVDDEASIGAGGESKPEVDKPNESQDNREKNVIDQFRGLRNQLDVVLRRMKDLEEKLSDDAERGKTDSLENNSKKKDIYWDNEEKEDVLSDQKNTLSERIRARIEKAKQSPGFKSFAKKAIPLAIVSSMVLNGIAGSVIFANQQNRTQDTSSGPQVESKYDNGSVGSGENREVRHGIYDGYNKTGMFMSAHKGTAYDFANAKEVAGAVGEDKCDIMKEVDHNQVETLADHLANIPDRVKAKYGISPEFMGLSILYTETRLQNLSDDEFDKLSTQVDQIWDDAFTRSVTLDGEYQNAYMRLIDPSKPAIHDNIELVECTTLENGTSATEFFWTVDGNGNSEQLGTMVVKISDDFNGCIQAVNPFGSNTQLYSGMASVARSAENPGAPFVFVGETTTNETSNKPTQMPNQPPTSDEPTSDKSTPDESGEEIQSKDGKNLERIDRNINEDIAKNIGTGDINITSTPGVSQENLTEQPSFSDFEGTEPEVISNESADSAEQVQDQVGEENNFASDRGGINQSERAPVEENNVAQKAADANGSTGVDNPDGILEEAGIN